MLNNLRTCTVPLNFVNLSSLVACFIEVHDSSLWGCALKKIKSIGMLHTNTNLQQVELDGVQLRQRTPLKFEHKPVVSIKKK